MDFSKQVDRDLSTPEHDKLMIALLKKDKWEQLIVKYDLFGGLYLPETLQIEAEAPVGETVYFHYDRPREYRLYGFVDIEVKAKTASEDTGAFSQISTINCEIKATEKSFGSLLRQVRNYRRYTEGRWVVVSPWEEWKEPLESEGITWISSAEVLAK